MNALHNLINISMHYLTFGNLTHGKVFLMAALVRRVYRLKKAVSSINI